MRSERWSEKPEGVGSLPSLSTSRKASMARGCKRFHACWEICLSKRFETWQKRLRASRIEFTGMCALTQLFARKMWRGYLSIKHPVPHTEYGESRSIGRSPHCDCGGCGIVPRLLPHYTKRNRRLTLDRQNYDYRSEYRWGFGRAIGA